VIYFQSNYLIFLNFGRRAWAVANGCEGAEGEPEAYLDPLQWDGFNSGSYSYAGTDEDGAAGGGDVLSSCVGWTRCEGGSEVIECLHPGVD